MCETFKISCLCGKHAFVFTCKPWCKTEVKCPECGQVLTYDPDQKEEKEEKSVKKNKE